MSCRESLKSTRHSSHASPCRPARAGNAGHAHYFEVKGFQTKPQSDGLLAMADDDAPLH